LAVRRSQGQLAPRPVNGQAPSLPVSLRGAGGDALTVKNNVPARAVTRRGERPRGQAVAEAPGQPPVSRAELLALQGAQGLPGGGRCRGPPPPLPAFPAFPFPSPAWARAPEQARPALRRPGAPGAGDACARGAPGPGPGGRPRSLSQCREARWGPAGPSRSPRSCFFSSCSARGSGAAFFLSRSG